MFLRFVFWPKSEMAENIMEYKNKMQEIELEKMGLISTDKFLDEMKKPVASKS